MSCSASSTGLKSVSWNGFRYASGSGSCSASLTYWKTALKRDYWNVSMNDFRSASSLGYSTG